MTEMTDRKPYLLRAIYEWILDNDCTPHLVIGAPSAGWVHGVPRHLLQEKILVLNISPTATENCTIENDCVHFKTRFGGQSHNVWVNMKAIVSLVARETGEGITLPVADHLEDGPPVEEISLEKTEKTETAAESAPATKKTPNHLKIIK